MGCLALAAKSLNQLSPVTDPGFSTREGSGWRQPQRGRQPKYNFDHFFCSKDYIKLKMIGLREARVPSTPFDPPMFPVMLLLFGKYCSNYRKFT